MKKFESCPPLPAPVSRNANIAVVPDSIDDVRLHALGRKAKVSQASGIWYFIIIGMLFVLGYVLGGVVAIHNIANDGSFSFP